MTLTTTFQRLRKAGACKGRYKFLRQAMKGVKDNEPIDLLTILDLNGFDDALWALRATVENCDKAARLIAADFAAETLHLWQKHEPTDHRPELAIKAARDFAHGRISAEELAAAEAAARAAAWDAAVDAAGDAAGDAAEAAARAAAWDAAWDAARAAGDAAGDAAEAAARAAAWDAAWDAAWAKQKEILIRYLQPEVTEVAK